VTEVTPHPLKINGFQSFAKLLFYEATPFGRAW
jgi:hypothetical protein